MNINKLKKIIKFELTDINKIISKMISKFDVKKFNRG